MIKNDFIAQLKDRLDIIEIVGNYVDLKKMGSTYIALCPFHSEKTASFVINPIKKVYHCYGCGVGGDAISFLMEYEKLDFKSAVEKLADMYGISVEYEDSIQHSSKSSDHHIFEQVIDFYQDSLLNNSQALNYLSSRGLKDDFVRLFKIGFCPGNIESLRFFDRIGIDKNKLIELSILGNHNGRYFSRFKDRIIFPIYSDKDKPVGLGGRLLPSDAAQTISPKYLNSPQSILFNKSKLLFGYHLAKEYIYKKKEIIVVEGYLDVVMLHQAGFRNSVATLGTAFGDGHVSLLQRGDPRVILSFDGDSAGLKAAFKASLILSNFDGGVVILDRGMDPADMVASNKIEELRNKFSSPIPFIEFILGYIVKQYDLSYPIQKQKALEEALAFLHTQSPLLQESYRDFLAHLLGINPINISIRYNKQKMTPQLPINIPSNLGNEASILSYMIEDRSLLDIALRYISPEFFFEYKDAFNALCKNELNHPGLTSLQTHPFYVNFVDKDPSARRKKFEKELNLFLVCYNRNLLKSIQTNHELDFSQKSSQIKELKTKLLKLQKGDLSICEMDIF